MSPLKRKRNAYEASFKLKVVKFALTCGNNCKTAADFGISENQVRDWRKITNELSEMPCTKKARWGFRPSFPKEEELQSWLLGLRQDGYIVTHRGTFQQNYYCSATNT